MELKEKCFISELKTLSNVSDFLVFDSFDFLKNTNSKISNEYALSKKTANSDR